MAEPLSESPLSDLMAAYRANETPECFARFVAAFRKLKVGVTAVDLPPGPPGKVTSTAEHPISLGLTRHGGHPRILTFADPVLFAKRFGLLFNGDMTGEDVMRTAMNGNDCAGILVNSALTETSVKIDREVIASLITSSNSPAEPAQQRPWWRFW